MPQREEFNHFPAGLCKAAAAPVYGLLIRYRRPRLPQPRERPFAILIRDARKPRREPVIDAASVADVRHIALSADGRRVGVSVGQAVRMWDVALRSEVAAVRGGRVWPNGVEFSPDGRYLGVLFQDSVSLYDTTSWTVARTYAWKVGKLLSLAFSPDGATAAVGSDTGKVVVFDLD